MQRRSAYAIVTDIAQTKGFSKEDLFARTRVPELDRLRVLSYVALRDEKGWGASRIAVLFNRDKGGIHRAMKRHDERSKIVDLASQRPCQVEELEAQVRRLSGVELCLQVSHRLDFPMWKAVFLSILMESYPRVRTGEDICELYDCAWERLYVTDKDAVSPEMIRQFSSRIRKWARDEGLSPPIHRINPGGMVLSDEMAVWLHSKFGKPIAVMEAA